MPASARDEVERLRRLQELTAGLRLKEAPPEAWEVFWNSIYNRAERSLGWILLSIGLVVIGGFACYQLVAALVATEVLPWWMKAASPPRKVTPSQVRSFTRSNRIRNRLSPSAVRPMRLSRQAIRGLALRRFRCG